MAGRLGKDGKTILVYTGVSIGVWLFFRYLFPLAAPFFLAYFLVLLVHPLVNKISKKIKLNKGLLSAILMLLFLIIIGVAGYFLLKLLFGQLGGILENWQSYKALGISYLEKCCCMIEEFFHLSEGTIREGLARNLTDFAGNMRTKVLPGVMETSWDYMKQTVAWISALFIAFIAAIFILSDYEKLHIAMEKIPFFSHCKRIKNNMLRAIRSFCKAQLIIMFIIGGVCTLVFLFMGNPYALVLGIGVGILDALPIFGTGLVLIPFAILEFIQGRFLLGIGMLALYGVCNFIREFLEPKLVGNEMGMSPLFFLAAVYWGLCLFGIWGVFLGPLAGLLIKEIGMAILNGDSCPETLTKRGV